MSIQNTWCGSTKKKHTKKHIDQRRAIELSTDRAAAVEAHWCSWYTAVPVSSTCLFQRWLSAAFFWKENNGQRWWKISWNILRYLGYILKYLELSWIWRMFNIKNQTNKGFRMFPAKSTNKNAIAIARRFQKKKTSFRSWVENSN